MVAEDGTAVAEMIKSGREFTQSRIPQISLLHECVSRNRKKQGKPLSTPNGKAVANRKGKSVFAKPRCARQNGGSMLSGT